VHLALDDACRFVREDLAGLRVSRTDGSDLRIVGVLRRIKGWKPV